MLEADAKTAGKEKKAVILDIDETVLDNSPYEAQCIIERFSYPERWDEWCELSRAEACPGAIDFLSYAVSAGYEIFYVTIWFFTSLPVPLHNTAAGCRCFAN